MIEDAEALGWLLMQINSYGLKNREARHDEDEYQAGFAAGSMDAFVRVGVRFKLGTEEELARKMSEALADVD